MNKKIFLWSLLLSALCVKSVQALHIEIPDKAIVWTGRAAGTAALFYVVPWCVYITALCLNLVEQPGFCYGAQEKDQK